MVIDQQESSKEKHKGIPATPDNKAASMGSQLKCLHAKTHSMKDKQEELVTCTTGLSSYWNHGASVV